jgi:hypothetical protein
MTTLPPSVWEPRPLATLGASTACNRNIFTLFYVATDRFAIKVLENVSASKVFGGHSNDTLLLTKAPICNPIDSYV